ncbi:MAG: hypothetical protein NTX86_06435 [Candidatus Dependentiae bacterium]|nr:hypothetical protein [Candidatus Dependentiae bacterium]
MMIKGVKQSTFACVLIVALLSATLSIQTIPPTQMASGIPYNERQAAVRIGTGLCKQELYYLNQRLPGVKAAIEAIVGSELKDNEVPRIAFCSSGGGLRAAISTLGLLQGAELQVKRQPARSLLDFMGIKQFIAYITLYFAQWFGWNQPATITPNNDILEPHPLNLLDACTYTASLSGSSWALAGLNQSRMSPTNYLEHLSNQINKSLITDVDVQEIVFEIIEKCSYGQPVSLIDIYGGLLAHKFLKNLGNSDESAIDLTSYASLTTSAQIPLPIHTAIMGEKAGQYIWVEFTPYEIGSVDLRSFIPTWAFGRKFNNGTSTDFAPPQAMGYGMGIWGSAISMSAKEFFNLVIEPELGTIGASYLESQFGHIAASGAPALAQIYLELTKHKERCAQDLTRSLLDTRISPAQVFNWAYGMATALNNEADTITLVDAGIDFSIALPPLLRSERAVDIIILCDYSGGTIEDDLREADAYAQRNGLRFPTIDYSKVNQVCSVHRDASNPTAPIIIYMPLIKNDSYSNGWDPKTADFTATLNLEYTKDQTALLSGLSKQNMIDSQRMIIDTIKQWIEDKRKE